MFANETLDVLLHLFQDPSLPAGNTEVLHHEATDHLVSLGFHIGPIMFAYQWIDSLCSQTFIKNPSENSFRVYNSEESETLDTDCLEYLRQAEKDGILCAQTRELLLSQVMLLNLSQITIESLKLVTLMVLSILPEFKSALVKAATAFHIQFHEEPEVIH
jgi:uncharacterized protein Smg (DUF494 family)